jgi:cation diffusion facilitator CzcD-associated flavoprotein CzcO
LAFLGSGKISKAMTARIKDETKTLIDASFPDPEAAAALLPTFKPGCKRLLISNDWYSALAKPNVKIVTSSIEMVDPTGVTTSDGHHHELDVLVLATGFAVSDFPSPLTVFGRSGVNLADHWADGASTDFGITVSGFPNLWFLAGPGTGLGHNSIVFMIEVQLQQIGRALRYMRNKSVATIELRREVEDASSAE